MSRSKGEEQRLTEDRRRIYFWTMQALVAVSVIVMFLLVTEGDLSGRGTLIGLVGWTGIAVLLSAPFASLALNFRFRDDGRPANGIVRLLAGAVWAVVGFGVAFVLGAIGSMSIH